ncbi:TetR family transcriptional regulator [Dulcicalothrix desertica PCC 7102]|uniref:TetR family transcriptional regulator n=1 Tax=Dulcicalothrix desertica PCC 7102 TaxID=232991 RepID=A0A3S1IUZ2_9CYAN|nr:TetR/AcrR family transcriptional regulator [Dulcicalothrix desertica]RUT02827.1 TetR family transcriptional regulator [Dulcicalothrix desertica PCC 7102]TWH38940.1 TetR family transcriptional regulator [Dulcicalothrix desertica PCC 7102]
MPEPLRRLPQQARSRLRFNQILDAAALVFEEVGYEMASTELIAVRANTSIGSLYRFFPDKSAILHALGERYASELKDLFVEIFHAKNLGKPLADILNEAVDLCDIFYSNNLAARIIFLQSQAFPQLQTMNRRLDNEIAVIFDTFLALRQPNVEAEQRRLMALMVVEIASALQLFYWNQDEQLRQKIVTETKLVLIRYLEPIF